MEENKFDLYGITFSFPILLPVSPSSSQVHPAWLSGMFLALENAPHTP